MSLKYFLLFLLKKAKEFESSIYNLFPKSENFFFYLLAFGVLSIIQIPWGYGIDLHLGFDFSNLYLFHHCEFAKISPYLIPGGDCGDLLNRDMIYPPLLYWLFGWTKFFDFETAYLVWCLFMIAAMGFVLAAIFMKLKKKNIAAYNLLIPFLFFLQLPFVYAIERGNNDILIVLFWATSYFLYLYGFSFVAGIIVGLCCLLKIYPVFGAIVLGFIELRKNRLGSRFVIGGILATLCGLLLLRDQSFVYFFDVLPQWSKSEVIRDVTAHSIRSIRLGDPWLPLLISIYLLYSWIKQDGLKDGNNVELNFFGSLAIMTYFSNTTNDYNLVTTYPLIFYSWMGMYSDDLKQAKFYAYTFFIGIVSILGYRFLWHNQVYNLAGLHVLFQIYWLFLFTRRASFG